MAKLSLSKSYSMNSLSSPKRVYPNRSLGSTPKQAEPVQIPKYTPRYRTNSRMSLSTMAETTPGSSLGKTKSISNLSAYSISSRRSGMSKSKSTMNLSKVQLSHSNWDIAQRSPKRSPRENQTTQAWESFGQGQRSKLSEKTTKLADRAREIMTLERNLESLSKRKVDLEKSLQRINTRDGNAAMRHQARKKQNELESQLDRLDVDICSISRQLQQP